MRLGNVEPRSKMRGIIPSMRNLGFSEEVVDELESLFESLEDKGWDANVRLDVFAKSLGCPSHIARFYNSKALLLDLHAVTTHKLLQDLRNYLPEEVILRKRIDDAIERYEKISENINTMAEEIRG